ncbi:hypothetical protein TUM20985_11050 [Mycobacterium antarcticum]|uniref:DUF5642 family protein n=1 Tax=unclassified Mycolicibacterium TaxID=2636767 RepID=UPI0023851B6B|nr:MULTISPECIES: DUF5642 family protein [unclassified Mycolicibacterium]BDX30558.1 hypothetical protein TUM20985_11050 [Mycolicibacterium sp. TUM20985]GLP79682.1 hypothetical protein TUM20984_11020 [Mycolicibacterium sp. TUM20984]
MLRTLLALAVALVLAACSSGPPADDAKGDIAKVLDVKSSFGPDFTVSTVAPTGIDPRLLAQQPLPPGAVFDPPDCAKAATGLTVPPGLKGNMAATTAEGDGNRFIAIALETSEALQVVDPGETCKKVAFAGGGVRGLVEVVEAPTIDGVRTLGTHRVVQTLVDGKPATGELYNYLASFSTFRVIVTANPLVVPGKPVVPVDTQRARDLLTAAVAAVRGS